MQNYLIVVFWIALIVTEGSCVMTRAQIHSTGKILRNVCQPKTKISAAQIDDIHKGIFNDDATVKSYMECVLRTGQLMKDGGINFEFIYNTLNNMEPDLATPTKASMEACKGVSGADKYDIAFAFYKCMYEDNPQNFFFP